MIMSHDQRAVQRATTAGREALELSFAWWQEHRQYMAELQTRTGLSPMEVHAVRGLDQDAPTATLTLAGRINCEPSNITTIVDRLERAGLIDRRPDPGDRRVRLVTLTRAGLEVRSRIDTYLHTPPAAINRLSAAEQRVLRDLLRKMTNSPTA